MITVFFKLKGYFRSQNDHGQQLLRRQYTRSLVHTIRTASDNSRL